MTAARVRGEARKRSRRKSLDEGVCVCGWGGGGGGGGEGLPYEKVGDARREIFVSTHIRGTKRAWFNHFSNCTSAAYEIGNARFAIKAIFCRGSSFH